MSEMEPACSVDGSMADSKDKVVEGTSGVRLGPTPDNNAGMAAGGFVAVHVGAGYHAPSNSDVYKAICYDACWQAMALLRQKKPALEVLKRAIMFLEDAPWTNAGTGSNLTVQGTVECDASIMDGQSLQYGAVGAVAGVKNPILVAENLLQTQLQGTMSLGRIPPSLLVSSGAYDWAVRHNIPTVNTDSLVTASAHKAFSKHKRKLDAVEEASAHQRAKVRRTEPPQQANGTDGTFDNKDENTFRQCQSGKRPQEDRLLDTIGAVCVDNQGVVVSAVSSGGIVLKQPGRLGQAALYGCGCWAENRTQDGVGVGVGVSTTGCGEHLTKVLMAKECADGLHAKEDPTAALYDTFHKKFLESPFLRAVDQKQGGCLAVRSDNSTPSELQVEVLWAHTTDSMCLAYMSTEDLHPTTFVSRLPEGSRCGKSVLVQSQHVVIPVSDTH